MAVRRRVRREQPEPPKEATTSARKRRRRSVATPAAPKVTTPARLVRPETVPDETHHDTDDGVYFIDGNGMSGMMSHDCYIGLDLSLTGTGMTILTDDGRYFLWRYSPPIVVHKEGRGATDRLIMIENFLDSRFIMMKLRGGNVRHICVEGLSYGSVGMVASAAQLQWLAKRLLRRHFWREMPVGYPTFVSPAGVKKFATGSGDTKKIKKEHILLGVYKKWGLDLIDNNMADSYVLAETAKSIVTGETDFQYQAEVIANLQLHTELPEDGKPAFGVGACR